MSQLSEILHGDSKSGNNNKSFIARLGQLGQKYTDPLAWAFGRKYTDNLVKIADLSNKTGSTVGRPFVKADKTLNPLRRVGAYDKVASWTEAKPGDTGAIAAGAYFGGGALGGGGAGNSGYAVGGSGAAPTATGAGAAGGAAEAIPEVVVTGSTGSGAGTAIGAGAGAGGATAANSNGNNWRDQLQMPGQQDDSQAQADENRRQLEAMMEQERLRRESFRRNEIARSMLS